ncbi:MAG: response regulator [Terriglobales bacterium]
MTSILCVDDEPSTRALLVRLLARHGYRVLQASNVRGALGMVQREPELSLILLDLNMPELSGFDALKVLKGDDRTKPIPVVVVSSTSRMEDVTRAIEMGAHAVVADPVTDERVLAAVQRALGPAAPAA